MEKVKLTLFSLLSLGCLFFVFSKIYFYPAPEKKPEISEAELKKFATPSAYEYEEKLKKRKERYFELRENLTKLPPFRPPADRHLSEDQIERFWLVVNHCFQSFKEFRNRYLKKIKIPFAKAMATVAWAGVVYDVCMVEGLNKAQMRETEFNWVRDRLFEAALFAVNRKLSSGKYTPEEEEKLKRIQQQLCWGLGLKQDNPLKFFPEKLDISKIPRHNVELFLKYKDKVRWRKVNFEGIEFDYNDIMGYAKILPE